MQLSIIILIIIIIIIIVIVITISTAKMKNIIILMTGAVQLQFMLKKQELVERWIILVNNVAGEYFDLFGWINLVEIWIIFVWMR